MFHETEGFRRSKDRPGSATHDSNKGLTNLAFGRQREMTPLASGGNENQSLIWALRGPHFLMLKAKDCTARLADISAQNQSKRQTENILFCYSHVIKHYF